MTLGRLRRATAAPEEVACGPVQGKSYSKCSGTVGGGAAGRGDRDDPKFELKTSWGGSTSELFK